MKNKEQSEKQSPRKFSNWTTTRERNEGSETEKNNPSR
jgi:hypothetical protein